MVATTNLAMNVLLVSMFVIVVNNNMRTSFTGLIYTLAVIYVVFFIGYVIEIVQIVKTKANNKYWGKYDNTE